MVNISNLQDNLFSMSVVSMPKFHDFSDDMTSFLFRHTLKITKPICGVNSSRPYT